MKPPKHKRLLLAFGVLAALVLTARAATAALIVDVGTHMLVPDRAGQIIQIMVSGGDQVSGLNLFAMVKLF